MLSQLQPTCPAALLERAKGMQSMPTAVINAGTELAMISAKQAADEGIIEPILVGDREAIQALADDMGWLLAADQIVHAVGEQESAEAAVALVHAGRAKLLMKGHVHSDTMLRAVLNKEKGLRTGKRLSHVFHMSVPYSDKVLCVTDAVINVAPDLTTQQHIFNNCLELMQALGYEKPNVALLSAAEVPTSAMPSSVQAKEFLEGLTPMQQAAATVFGPVAFDGAVSPEAAKIKGISQAGAGEADVLLVPNIETGNAIFKQLVYFNSATAAGLILGAQVPIMLTSRADPPVARLASAALGVVYANWQQSQA